MTDEQNRAVYISPEIVTHKLVHVGHEYTIHTLGGVRVAIDEEKRIVAAWKVTPKPRKGERR